MNFKTSINKVLSSLGYQLSKAPYSERQISSGYFGWLQNAGIQTIIDVGANEGQFIEKISRILPGTRILAFEPLQRPLIELNRKYHEFGNIQIFNFALGDREEDAIIHHNEYSPSSSLLEITDLHKSAFPETAKEYDEQIKVKVMDEVVSALLPEKKILLKIDVQGFELHVLRGAKNILMETDIVIIETSFTELYKGQPLFDDVHSFLSERGFRFSGNLEQLYDKRDGRILQGDSLYIRN